MTLDRTLPHNLEAEKCVLGAILIDNAQFAQAAEFLDARDFFRDAHQRIWKTMGVLAEREAAIDLVTLKDELARNAELEQVGGPAYIASLTEGVPRAANVDHYAKILREKSSLRHLIHASTKILTSAFDESDAPAELLSEAIKGLVSLDGEVSRHKIPSHLKHISEVMTEIQEQWEQGPPPFIKMPWPDLNARLVGGMTPGEMLILGGGPGAGKTAAAGQIARYVASTGNTVVMVSREMKRTAIGGRLIAAEGKVDAGAVRRVQFTLDERKQAEGAMVRLSALPLFITHAPMSIDALREMIYVCQQETPIHLLIVDYLQLIDAPASVKERRLQVEAVSAGLKRLTIDFNFAVIALSALSRPPDDRAKPGLRALRESGKIEHDADTVLLLHRPDEHTNILDLIIAKARNGKIGQMQLAFNKTYQRFDQVSDREDYGT